MSIGAAAAKADVPSDIQMILTRQTVAELKALRRSVDIPEVSNRGFVYFVGGPMGAIKIGYARDLRKRLASLQTGSPVLLRVLATVPGGYSMERDYHRRFADHALQGEWFKDCREIRAEIKRLSRAQKVAA